MASRLSLPWRRVESGGTRRAPQHRAAGDRNESMGSALSRPLRDRVEAALDRLRPALVADGGGVELVDVEDDGTVKLALLGACVRCPAQSATLRLALEPALREEVPGVTSVIPV